MKVYRVLVLASAALVAISSGVANADKGDGAIQSQQQLQIRSQDIQRLQSRLNQGGGEQNRYEHRYEYRNQNNTQNAYGQGYESRMRQMGNGQHGGGRR